jgi:hypothetical protein
MNKKIDESEKLKKMLNLMYDRGFADCETAARLAIKTAVMQEREACIEICNDFFNNLRPKNEWIRRVSEAIKSRDKE